MSTSFKTIFLMAMLLLPAYGYTELPPGSAYINGVNSNIGLILCHGKGKYPTWLVVEPLRIGVNKRLGYHALSLQMPNDDKDWELYADDFPRAYSTITAAIKYLKDEKGVKTVILMGHSMGSRMAGAFVAENVQHGLKGLIIAGCRNNGGKRLSCYENMRNIAVPVLDIWGGANHKDTDAAFERKNFVGNNYKQVEISGADHKFTGHEEQFVTAVASWLQSIAQ